MIPLLLAALGILPSPATPTATPPPPGADARALYLEHCARCHGETGDGKGTTDLDRPARSFLLGGYSYGNTKNAVLRSVVHGIPGTPMPAFGPTLKEDELSAVAEYVISLGPPGTVVEPGASVMTVKDRPVIVHGMMPAVGEGARREPRSLVVGFPNGATFQYRMRDGHLVAIRQGEFLDRRDWGGRGGAALEPLGKVTWSGAVDLDPAFRGSSSGAVHPRRLTGATVRGDRVWIDFDVLGDDGQAIGGGREILSFEQVDGVPIATRAVVGVGRTVDVELAEPDSVRTEDGGSSSVVRSWATLPGKDLLFVEPGGRRNLRIYVHAPAWTPELRDAVVRSLAREED